MKETDKEIVDFLESIINNDTYVKEAQDFIKTNYGVSSEYDNTTSTLYIWTTNVMESLNVAAAADYLKDSFTPEMLNIKYGMKDNN